MSGADDGREDAKARESDEASAGIGAHLTWMVLGAVLVVVLFFAWRLHAFWWQA